MHICTYCALFTSSYKAVPLLQNSRWILSVVFAALQFTKESGNKVDEVKLRVVYVAPPQPPSPVPEESEESSSPRAFELDNGNLTSRELVSVS